jgi:hypothetical protein
MHLCLTHQAPFNLLHRKSKLSGFDKSGAWLMLVNFQPWQQTPVPLGAGSLRNFLKIRLAVRRNRNIGDLGYSTIQDESRAGIEEKLKN